MFGAGVLAMAPEVTVIVSDRSEVRVRDSSEGTGVSIDLETTPGLALKLTDPRWELDAAYNPRLTAQAINTAYLATDILHQGGFGVTWHAPRLRLDLREDLLYGEQNFSSLTLDSPITGLPVVNETVGLPPSTTLRYIDSRPALTARVTASRRWSLTGSFGFLSSGGVDETSRSILPYESGPHAELSGEYRISRTDRLTSYVTLTQLDFSSGPESTLVETTEGWRRALSPTADVSLRGGVVTSAALGAGEPLHWNLWPYAEMSLEGQLPNHVALVGILRLEPVVDRLTGLIDDRIQGIASVRWTFAPRWVFRCDGAVVQSLQVDEKNAISIVFGEAAFVWSASRLLSVEIGTRDALQEQTGVTPQPQWVGFIAATFTSHPTPP